jgi:betaine-aldehyde dehydrogenase
VAGGRRPDEPELQDGFYLRRRSSPTAPGHGGHPPGGLRAGRDRRAVLDRRRAVALGNDTTYGLAGAVWTNDASRAQRVAAALRHGTVWINDYNVYMPQAEWGGFRQSGLGRELGPTGLDEYREAKHVYQNTKPGPSGWFSGG